MFARTFRTLTAQAATAQATKIATASIRPSVFLGPLCIRTLTNATEAADAGAAATATSEAVPTSTPAEPVATSSTPSPAAAAAARKLPYFVGRNRMGNIGVYQVAKRGGNHLLTIVKNGEGDLVALKHDLRDVLKIHDKDIRVVDTNKHIKIRGHVRGQVVNYLLSVGF